MAILLKRQRSFCNAMSCQIKLLVLAAKLWCDWMPKGIILSKVSPVIYSDIFSLMLKLCVCVCVCVFERMHLETFWAMRWSRDTLVFLALLASQKRECFVNGKFCPALPFSLRCLLGRAAEEEEGVMRKWGGRFSIREGKKKGETRRRRRRAKIRKRAHRKRTGR